MKVNRNDPCPCGSGKKYKKCCLLKEKVVQISEVKEERFLQERHELLLKLISFLERKIPRKQMFQLHTDFRKRTQSKISDESEIAFFQYWLNFFHVYENGLRGIEWFQKENEIHLTQEERTLVAKWTNLTPKVVQAIGKSDTEILFEEVSTKEHFTIFDNKQYVTDFAPWFGTISLIEHFDNQDYFNGVRIFVGPQHISNINVFIQKLMEETKSSREYVLFHYYPEILGEFLKDLPGYYIDQKEKEFHHYTVQYQVRDEDIVIDFLQEETEFSIDYWEKHDKNISWLCNWKEYTDNEMEGKAILAESLGTISLKKRMLQFDCYDKDTLQLFKQKVYKLKTALELTNEKVESRIISFHIEVKNIAVLFSEDTPKYFGIYAQNNLNWENDIPIPMFDTLSARAMVDDGRADEVDTWLKQLEYNLYQVVKRDFEKVEITADFNTVRKKLGLPLSPFVTGGEKRKSTIIPIKPPRKQPLIKNEDIPFYENLGFTPATIDNFYAKSLVRFFQEKTNGKSENTVRKYVNSLYDLREILEAYSLERWDEITQKQWERIITKDYFDLFEYVSKTQVKDFLSTLKTLVKWLELKESMRLSEDLEKAIERTEKKRLKMVGY